MTTTIDPGTEHRRVGRPWWVPAVAVTVAVLIPVAAAVTWPQPTSPTTAEVPSTMPAAKGTGGSCRVPEPATSAQLAALAAQPATPPVVITTLKPARAQLTAMIRNLRPAACDQSTGQYTYTLARQWAVNTSPSWTRTLQLRVTQYQRWHTANDSGRTIIFTQPTTGPARTDTSYQAGELPARPTRLATDPDALAAQIDALQPDVGFLASGRIRGWADINDWHHPTVAERAAALGMLATTRGITVNSLVTDRADRTGIAITATSTAGIRDLVILDPDTAELLAYEQAALRDPGGLGISEPTVLNYVLHLAHARTSTTHRP